MNHPLVLLADDDALLHRVLALKAAQQNWRLVSAYDGAQCLRLALSEQPALIILDGMMPVLDGFATLRELRRYPETSSVPVLMLSARNHEADVAGTLQHGADDYLPKPFSPAELLARVSRILAGGVPA